MTFHVYSVQPNQLPHTLVNTEIEFRLAGDNLLRRVWHKKNCPVNMGWSAGADELISELTGGAEDYTTRRLIIDYHPSNMNRIPLIEVLEVFAFSWGATEPVTVEWTPLMIRMRDVWDYQSEETITRAQRDRLKAAVVDPPYAGEFIEFLYLQGDAGGWSWGRNGSTNAVFIQNEARDYFRKNF